MAVPLFYDVVLIGRTLATLTTAALLARRSWRVLVVSGTERQNLYHCGAYPFFRRPTTLHAHASPVLARMLGELGMVRSFRRPLIPLDPMFQVLSADERIDVRADVEALAEELGTFLPAQAELASQHYASLGELNGLADKLIGSGSPLPPEKFWDRLRWKLTLRDRSFQELSAFAPSAGGPLLERLAQAIACTYGHELVPRSPGAVARLHALLARGTVSMPEHRYETLLGERVRTLGGEIHWDRTVTSIVTQGERVVGVELDHEDVPVRTEFVATSMSHRELLLLATQFVPPRRTLAELAAVHPMGGRFVVSLVFPKGRAPSLLAERGFALAKRPALLDLFWLREDSNAQFCTLVFEAIVDQAELGIARERILESATAHFPFLLAGACAVDSPHDGLPVWILDSGKRRDVPRESLRASGVSAHAEQCPLVYRIDHGDLHGLGGEALRTPLENAYALGPTVLPGLGQEGELLASWAVAQAISDTNKTRDNMRREMWKHIEVD
jgi:Flavin containing amine oxidoreductase